MWREERQQLGLLLQGSDSNEEAQPSARAAPYCSSLRHRSLGCLTGREMHLLCNISGDKINRRYMLPLMPAPRLASTLSPTSPALMRASKSLDKIQESRALFAEALLEGGVALALLVALHTFLRPPYQFSARFDFPIAKTGRFQSRTIVAAAEAQEQLKEQAASSTCHVKAGVCARLNFGMKDLKSVRISASNSMALRASHGGYCKSVLHML